MRLSLVTVITDIIPVDLHVFSVLAHVLVAPQGLIAHNAWVLVIGF